MLERGFVYLLFGLYFVIGIVIGSFFECLYLQAAAGEICYQPSVSLRQLRTQVRGSGYDTCSKLFLAARQVPLL